MIYLSAVQLKTSNVDILIGVEILENSPSTGLVSNQHHSWAMSTNLCVLSPDKDETELAGSLRICEFAQQLTLLFQSDVYYSFELADVGNRGAAFVFP